jgi:hypothetical protein
MSQFVVGQMYHRALCLLMKDFASIKKESSWQLITIHRKTAMDLQDTGEVWPNAICRSKHSSFSWKTWAKWNWTWSFGQVTTPHMTFGHKPKITTSITLTPSCKGSKRQPVPG